MFPAEAAFQEGDYDTYLRDASVWWIDFLVGQWASKYAEVRVWPAIIQAWGYPSRPLSFAITSIHSPFSISSSDKHTQIMDYPLLEWHFVYLLTTFCSSGADVKPNWKLYFVHIICLYCLNIVAYKKKKSDLKERCILIY